MSVAAGAAIIPAFKAKLPDSETDMTCRSALASLAALSLFLPAVASAAPPDNAQLAYAIDNFALLICAVLVLFMQAGFAMLTAGFVSQKNVVNILFKNVMDMCVGVVLYFAIGYGLMYPGDPAAEGAEPTRMIEGTSWFAFAGFGISADQPEEIGAGVFHPQIYWMFQAAFAAAAATIVAGSVAGRMKFVAYLVYSALLTGLVYPISGYWKWGEGWLHQLGFYDFAGSGVVHMVGGFAGLAGAIALGPRLGRYDAEGRSVPMPGHSISLATLGVFILWVGWYGFNPGSMLAFSGVDEAGVSAMSSVVMVAVNTTLAGGAGGIVAMVVSWGMFRKADFSMALNGALGGLVGITANADGVSNTDALIIGSAAGVLIIAGVLMLDKLKIDDPVGAWPVHGLCGMWGVLAVAIFGNYDSPVNDEIADSPIFGNLMAQLIGIVVLAAWAFGTMYVIFMVMKAVGILRVNPEDEERGLDISEHGMSAYTTT